MELKQQVLPKSPSGAAVRYALNQWKALNVYLEDGELEIDNGATERANRDIAKGCSLCTSFSNV
jgi:transposase